MTCPGWDELHIRAKATRNGCAAVKAIVLRELPNDINGNGITTAGGHGEGMQRPGCFCCAALVPLAVGTRWNVHGFKLLSYARPVVDVAKRTSKVARVRSLRTSALETAFFQAMKSSMPENELSSIALMRSGQALAVMLVLSSC